jgi:hypothetical protein
VKRNGVGAGVEKTMSMSERGEMAAGKPKTGHNESTTLVLYHEGMILMDFIIRRVKQVFIHISDLVYLFEKNGVSVQVVLDGPYRHHSKKARAHPVMEVDQAWLDSLLLRQKLLRQIDTLRDASSDLTNIETVEKEIVILEKLIRSREKKFQESAAIPTDFAECSEQDSEQDSKQDSHSICCMVKKMFGIIKMRVWHLVLLNDDDDLIIINCIFI